MRATLELALLGPPQVRLAGQPITTFKTLKAQALLYYLAVTGQPHTRSSLAGLLWGDMPETQARVNLSKAVSELRALVGEHLTIERQQVAFDRHSDHWLDLHDLQRSTQDLLDEERPLDVGQPSAPLAETIALYRGDFLDGFYVRDAPDFELWVLAERGRQREWMVQVLHRLVESCLEQRQWATGIGYARRLLALEPWRESAHHRLILLLARGGDRSAALAQYETCCRVLDQELGVEPMPEIQALAAQLRQAAASSSAAQERWTGWPREPGVEPGRGTRQAHARLPEHQVPAVLRGQRGRHPSQLPLVGRQREWHTLRSAWEALAESQAHFCLIRGEAGIGKTRLAEELVAWVQGQGFAAATTRSYAGSGSLAYTPVIELLRSETVRPALETLDNIWLTEVSRLLPELRAQRPDLPRPEPLTDRWRRQRLFEALAQVFLTSFGERQGSGLLVVDDLQWCDADTLAWLHYLLFFAHQADGRQEGTARLLVVGTVREEEVDRDHPLQELLLALHREGQVSEISLSPLGPAESARLAGEVVHRRLDQAAAARLYAQTEGNPLFIVETMRAREPSHESGSQGSSTSHFSSLPPKVQAVIQQRLSQLTPAAREVAALAAAIGRAFSVELLQQAANAEDPGLVGRLEELWRRGIVREQGSGAYDFSHDRIREVAYAAISPIQRPVLHQHIAEALEQIHGDDLDPVSAQLAAHHARTSTPARAIPFYQRAAEVAAARFDHAHAVELLQAGLDLLQAQPETAERVAQEAALLLAQANSLSVVQGFTVPAIAGICMRIEQLLPSIDDDPLRFHAHQRLRGYYGAAGQMDIAHRHGTQILAVAQRLEEPVYRLGACQANGIINLQLGRFAEGRQYMEQAESLRGLIPERLPRWLSSDSGRTGVSGNLALTLWLLGYPDQAGAKAADIVAVAERDGDPFRWSIALFFALLVYRYMRAVGLAEALVQKFCFLDARYEIPISSAESLYAQGWVRVRRGELMEGIARMRAGIDEMKAMHHTMFQTHRLAWLAEAQMQAGLWDAAAATLDEGFDMAEGSGQRSGDAELHRLLGEWLVGSQPAGRSSEGAISGPDRHDEAEASFFQAIEIARVQEAKSFELRAVMSLCRLWQRQGRRAEARDQLAEIYGWFSEGFDTADLQEARALLTELA